MNASAWARAICWKQSVFSAGPSASALPVPANASATSGTGLARPRGLGRGLAAPADHAQGQTNPVKVAAQFGWWAQCKMAEVVNLMLVAERDPLATP